MGHGEQNHVVGRRNHNALAGRGDGYGNREILAVAGIGHHRNKDGADGRGVRNRGTRNAAENRHQNVVDGLADADTVGARPSPATETSFSGRNCGKRTQKAPRFLGGPCVSVRLTYFLNRLPGTLSFRSSLLSSASYTIAMILSPSSFRTM